MLWHRLVKPIPVFGCTIFALPVKGDPVSEDTWLNLDQLNFSVLRNVANGSKIVLWELCGINRKTLYCSSFLSDCWKPYTLSWFKSSLSLLIIKWISFHTSGFFLMNTSPSPFPPEHIIQVGASCPHPWFSPNSSYFFHSPYTTLNDKLMLLYFILESER
jgi:hypothetical protein